MAEKKLSEVKDKDEKRWMIEDAARTIREFGRISKQPDLLKAAQKELDNLKKESDAATKKVINAISAKSANMKVKDDDK